MFSIKKLVLLALILITTSCGSMSEVGKIMRNEKITNTDEFLVKKKEPLTLPPDFAEIPEPGSLEKKKNDEIEKKKIEKAFKIKKQKQDKFNSGTLEESILKKIGK